MTFLTGPEARSVAERMSLAYREERGEDGRAFSGPQHWHVFDLIATTDVDDPTLFSPGTACS